MTCDRCVPEAEAAEIAKRYQATGLDFYLIFNGETRCHDYRSLTGEWSGTSPRQIKLWHGLVAAHRTWMMKREAA